MTYNIEGHVIQSQKQKNYEPFIYHQVKLLKLFSYLQNCQSYGTESVEKSPKTGILIPTGNGSSPTLTLLGGDIPHESSSNP